MSAEDMSVDELVAALKRTSLPTVLVEGRDDMTAYRWIEDKLGATQANVLACGGREKLLAVYDRSNEFAGLRHAFVADRDMWLFTVVPKEYRCVVFTSGYSIENDILDSSHVDDLLSTQEHADFETLADQLARWFAFEVQEFRAGRHHYSDVHVNQLIPLGRFSLDADFLGRRGFREPNRRLTRSIRENIGIRMRGKNLLQLYARFLSAPGRGSKFSKSNLLEMAAKCGESPHLMRLIRALKRKMG